MQYILNENEYWSMKDLKAAVESLTDANDELTQKLEISEKVNADYLQNLKSMSHRLEVAESVRKQDREQIKALSHARDLDNKKLAEQAHELLVKEAELADLSSKLREAKRDCEGTSKALAETQKISAMRLESMNNLMREVRCLRAEHVCIATNPQNGHIKVISVVKADTYRKFGWMVSEEYLVDRPA